MSTSSPLDLGPLASRWLGLTSPVKVLGAIVVIALIHSTLYFQSVISADGVSYARIAESIATEFQLRASSLVFTPGYPLLMAPLVWLTGDGELSGALVSLLGTLASVALVGILGRRLFGLTTGALAALSLALSVYFIRKSYWVMSEPTYSFFTVASAVLVIGLLRRYTHGKAVLLGLALSFLQLTRPEGLVPAVVALTVLACMGAFGGPQRRKLLLGAILASAMVAASYVGHMMQVHELTGKWVGNTKLHNNWYIANKAKIAEQLGIPKGEQYEAIQYGLDDEGEEGTDRFPEPKILEEVLADPGYYIRHYLQNVAKELLMLLRALNVIAPFVLLGLLYALRDLNTRTESLFLLTFALPLVIYPVFYITDRNVEAVLPILIVFGAVGLVQAFRWYQRTVTARASPEGRKTLVRSALVGTSALMLAPVLAVIAVKTWELYSPRARPEYVHKVAGLWLREHSRPTAVVMARKPWAGFYANREATPLPYGDVQDVMSRVQKRGVSYVVIDDGYTRPALREQLAEQAEVQHLRPVFTADEKGNRLVIYEVNSSHPQ